MKTVEQLAKLEEQKQYLQIKIKELRYYKFFDPYVDPYVDIATSNLQLALNQIEKRKTYILGRH